jgi:hypothetical protein
MLRAFALSFSNDDRLLACLRKIFPPDLSPELVPTAERMVTEAGEALRQKMYNLFINRA